MTPGDDANWRFVLQGKLLPSLALGASIDRVNRVGIKSEQKNQLAIIPRLDAVTYLAPLG